ncbi:MAG: hypothetical protein QNK18_14975 [Gammaproteobacteria bacterium]|nr:hypothetical protein [Gammaproteobacteria bacterium]
MPNWMTNVRLATAPGASPFAARPLNEITVPGTHDAGCYTNTWGALVSRTQSQNIPGQLAGGIRYFDLRPCKYGQQFWTYHGPYWGGRLDGGAGILQDVATFMSTPAVAGAAGAQELVVLNISHFSNFDGSDHHRLINEILLRLGPFLVPHNQSAFNLFNSTYDAVLTGAAGGPTSRVAVLYDGALDEAFESLLWPAMPDGFFKLRPKYGGVGPNQLFLFDQYANQATLVPMRNDQMAKLANRANYTFCPNLQPKCMGWPGAAGNWTNNAPYALPPTGIQDTWHLFSWTLTPQNPVNWWATGGTISPMTIAQTVGNPALEGWFTGNNWPIGAAARGYDPMQDQRINVIYVDDYASQIHNCPAGGACPRNGYAAPVALCEFINRSWGAWPGWAGY